MQNNVRQIQQKLKKQSRNLHHKIMHGFFQSSRSFKVSFCLKSQYISIIHETTSYSDIK